MVHPIHHGVRRFQEVVWPRMSERFVRLADGQSPEVLFVGCSDSRVDPNLLCQSGPGELFVVRNAGNLVPAYGADQGSAASIEYAVAVLKVRHVVVCGHSGCGAVAGALSPDAVASLPAVRDWVKHAHVAVEDHLQGKERLAAAVRANVIAQLDNLEGHPAVRQALDEGRLTLHGWVFDIGTGDVHEIATREPAQAVAK